MFTRLSPVKSLSLFVLTGALCLGLAGTGLAQDEGKQKQSSQAQEEKKSGPSMGTMGSKDAQKLQKMQQKMQRLQKKLGNIRKQALKENEDLKKKEEDLKALVEKKMDENMADKEVDKDRMDEIRNKIRDNKNMSQTKKRELIKEYQKNARVYQQAQKKTFQDSEVQKKREEFKEKLTAAMNEVNPEADKILDKLENINKKMRMMQRQKMQQRRQQKKQQQKGMQVK